MKVARLIGVREAAEYCGVSYNTMCDYVNSGLVPTVKLPARKEDGGLERRSRLIDRLDLDRMIEEKKQEVAPENVPTKRGTSGKTRKSAGKDWYVKHRHIS